MNSSSNLEKSAKTLALFLEELRSQPVSAKTELQRRLANKNPEFFRKKSYDELIAQISKNCLENVAISSVFSYFFA